MTGVTGGTGVKGVPKEGEGKILADGRTGIEGITRSPRGPKKKRKNEINQCQNWLNIAQWSSFDSKT